MSQIGKTGILEIPANKGGITVELSWREVVYSDLRSSRIEITGMRAKSRKWYGVSYFLDGVIRIDAVDVHSFLKSSEQYYLYWDALNKYAPLRVQKGGVNVPWVSDSIGRDTDGTKKIILHINITGYSVSGSADSGWNVSDEIEIDLTTFEPSEPESEPLEENVISSFFYNGYTRMVLFNGLPAIFIVKPPKVELDNAILGNAVLARMVLGNGG